MQKKEGVQDRGPNAVLDVRDKEQARTALANVWRSSDTTAKDTQVYVYAEGIVDMGDKQPIPAFTYVRVETSRIRRLREVARRNNIGFVVHPPGWHPGR